MEQEPGKLVLMQEGRPGREFELGKMTVTLGRALTNDIVLSDVRVSRTHARLECTAGRCEIVDQGSVNGVYVNGIRVECSALRQGDIIRLGSSQLRYEVAPVSSGMEATRLDSEADLLSSLEHEVLPMAINDSGVPKLVILSSDKTWEVVLDGLDSITIGRGDANGVVLDQPGVSRQHAQVVRDGQGWLLRDMGSTNGTWRQSQRVDKQPLADGDVFRVGSVQIVFKSGYTVEALTMLNESLALLPVRRPVIFVPGLMGSELWRGSERLWPSVKNLLAHPEVFRYPSEVPLEPRGIVDELVIVPNLIKQDQYNRLGDYMVEELGYGRGKDFFEFAYDWREDIRVSARHLARLVEELPTSQPITIMAHSLGTLVTRYFVERLGGKKRVERIMLMGGPHLGTVKALTSLLVSPQALPFGLMGERLRQVLATFPSSYQILPTHPCATDQNGKQIDFMADESWLSDGHVHLLRAAREFRAELGTHSGVPAVSIFGYGLKTPAWVRVKRGPSGQFSEITYSTENSGDSGVLEKSAILAGSEIHPIQQYHGSLFADNDVKIRLRLELARQTQT